MIDLLQRLRHRKLVQWALAYAAVAWVLLQVLGLMSDSFEWPHVVMQGAFVAAALGFVLAMVLAWYHGERGEQKVSGAELVIIAALFAIGGGLLWRGGVPASRPATKAPTPVAPRVVAATKPRVSIVLIGHGTPPQRVYRQAELDAQRRSGVT